MRKIVKDITNTIIAGYSNKRTKDDELHCQNTDVMFFNDGHPGVRVLFHGNEIFRLDYKSKNWKVDNHGYDAKCTNIRIQACLDSMKYLFKKYYRYETKRKDFGRIFDVGLKEYVS